MLLSVGKSKTLRLNAVCFLPKYLLHTNVRRPALRSLPALTDRFRSFRPILQSDYYRNFNINSIRRYCTPSEGVLDKLTFETVCTDTLDSLTEEFEELVESNPQFKNADVTYSDGVLTVKLGNKFGTYVINRQSPNLQIWLSSPISGPKRYDFVGGTWVYKHDGTTLHSLLDEEIGKISKDAQFVEKCSYSKGEVKL